ncbi:MAG: hypothetical protein H6833_00095 [Planctomycetes bacterium]|nr:hypothetical protein [Planctomycetota bacterium]
MLRRATVLFFRHVLPPAGLTGLVLGGLLVAPQAVVRAQAADIPSPILPKARLDALKKALSKWYDLDLEANTLIRDANEANERKREMMRKQASKVRAKARDAKEAFYKAFEKEGEKAGDLLRSVPDLLEIFSDCFPYEKQSNGGRARDDSLTKNKADGGYAFRFPTKYDPKASYPLIYVLPPKTSKGWETRKEYLDELWPKTSSEALESAIFWMPQFEEGAPLGNQVGPTEVSDTDRAAKSFFLRNLGASFLRFHVDTDRVLLQATGDSVPFALRMASQYADRFAGLILTDPKTSEFDGSTILSNLDGLSICLVSGGESKAHGDAIAKALEDAGIKNVKRIEAEGTAGFAAKADEIYTWVKDVQRNLFRLTFSHTPPTDRAWQSYWLQIVTAEYLADVKIAERPMVKVHVDREKNRIDIDGRNVSKVALFLNDLLVDLDKEITLVLNGQIKTIKVQRSLRLLADSREGLVVKRGDPRYIFVASEAHALPAKGEGDAAKGSGGDER